MSSPESESIIVQFQRLNIGGTMKMPVSQLTPSQPDDGVYSLSNDPIEAFSKRGVIIILHGNHRYWDMMRSAGESAPSSLISVKKVRNYIYDY